MHVAFPVRMGMASGSTRDVSASGMFLELDANCAEGTDVSFVIDINTYGKKMVLKCKGCVIRRENQDGKLGLAVNVTESVMEDAE